MSELVRAAKQALVRSLMRSRVSVRRSSATHEPGFVLLLTPSNQGSLGDEALIAATLDQLSVGGSKHVTVLSYGPYPHWTRFGPRRAGLTLDYKSLYSVADRLRFADWALSHESFILLGADVIDGAYARQRTLLRITCAQLAAEAGCATSIIGFSMRETPAAWALEELARLPSSVRLRARDPFSAERASRFLGRPVEVTADPAFLLRSESISPESAEVEAWVMRQRQMSRAIVGLNINSACDSEMRDALVTAHQKLIEGFSHAGHDTSFVFVPHDYRGLKNDVTIAERVVAATDPALRDRVTVAKGVNSAEVQHLCGLFDVTLCGRLHVAIASLAQGTPTVGIAHQSEFDGLFSHFALDEMTLSPKDACQGDKLLPFFLGVFDHRDPLRKRISSRLDNVRALARANFAP